MSGCGRGSCHRATTRPRTSTPARRPAPSRSGPRAARASSSARSPRQFEAANPGVKVNVTPMGMDVAHDKIISAIAGGATPDVSMIGTTWMGELAKTGAVDPTPGNLIDKSEFFPGSWDTVTFNGTSYGVPWYVETRAFYYRSDLAAKAGREAADDLAGDAGVRQGRQGQGRRVPGRLPELHGGQLAGAAAAGLAGRRRHPQGRQVELRHAADGAGAHAVPVLLQGRDRAEQGRRGRLPATTSSRARPPRSTPARG